MINNKIRVGIIGPCPPPYGGVTRLIANNLENWRTKDVEAYFIPNRIPDKPLPPDHAIFIDYRQIKERCTIPLYKAFMYIKNFPLMRLRNYLEFYKYNCVLSKLIRDYKLDILYAHHTETTGLSAVMQSDLCEIPSVIVSYGQTWLVTSLDKRFRDMAKSVLKKSTWVISTSEHCRKGALQLGADSKRSSVVYAGIDLKKFHPGIDGESYRRKTGIPLDVIVISNLGLSLRQKVDTFIKAIQLLKESKNTFFLLGGTGKDFGHIKEKIEKLSMDNIKMLGFIPENELPAFYAATDILVASPDTLTECMGQSIKEAMACAKPVVAANIGGGPEVISHMKNGLLFEPANPVELAKVLKVLIEDPILRKRLGDEAIFTAKEKFDTIKCSDDILSIFKRLILERNNTAFRNPC